jgi:deoxycytidine triphosphate deaminase
VQIAEYMLKKVFAKLFFEGDPCSTTYEDRRGKYQNQPEKVTLAKI